MFETACLSNGTGTVQEGIARVGTDSLEHGQRTFLESRMRNGHAITPAVDSHGSGANTVSEKSAIIAGRNYDPTRTVRRIGRQRSESRTAVHDEAHRHLRYKTRCDPCSQQETVY